MVASCGTGTNIVNFRIFKIRMAKMMRNMVIHVYINFRYMVGAQPTWTAVTGVSLSSIRSRRCDVGFLDLRDLRCELKKTTAWSENFMYTGLPPVPSCPCSCPCSCPLPLFLVPAGPLVVPSGLSGLSFMTTANQDGQPGPPARMASS